MIKVVEVTEEKIELEGISFLDGEKVEQIMNICHKYKHMFLDGYPCGRKTRKISSEKYRKWEESPGICFTYTITDDNSCHHLMIKVFVSEEDKLLKKYSAKEILHYKELYTLRVSKEIAAI